MKPLGSEDDSIYRVALANDDMAERDTITDLVASQARFRPHAANGWDELDGLLDEARYDVVILGERFAGMSGLEAHERLAKARRDAPATILIGPEKVPGIIKAFRCGIGDYLTKSALTAPELRSSIIRVGDRSRQRRQQAVRLEQLEKTAQKNAVTGLPNRQYLLERMESMIQHAHRARSPCGIIAVRFADIRSVYSAHGQKVGDQVLRTCGARLRDTARKCDLFGQYGDDTFMFLVDREVDAQSLQLICRRLTGTTEFLLNLDSAEIQLAADIHAVLYPADGTSVSELLERIDARMREKHRGHSPHASADDANPTPGTSPARGLATRDSDRRNAHRHRVLKRGVLILNGGFSTVNCVIRDISIGGAKVAVEGQFTAPRYMELLMVEKNEKVPTETRWQDGQSLGLKFIPGDVHLSAPEPGTIAQAD